MQKYPERKLSASNNVDNERKIKQSKKVMVLWQKTKVLTKKRMLNFRYLRFDVEKHSIYLRQSTYLWNFSSIYLRQNIAVYCMVRGGGRDCKSLKSS